MIAIVIAEKEHKNNYTFASPDSPIGPRIASSAPDRPLMLQYDSYGNLALTSDLGSTVARC